jgi:hypothetical protein
MGGDGATGWMEMCAPTWLFSGSLVDETGQTDIILAAADVEGNFMVVKVCLSQLFPSSLVAQSGQAYQYTDLLSCMLLDAYVAYKLSKDSKFDPSLL